MATLVFGGTVETFSGEPLEVFLDDVVNPTTGQDVVISYAGKQIDVVTTDVMASNGVIHVTDKVILPPPVTTTVAPPPTPILPGLNLCIPNLFEMDRSATPHAQVKDYYIDGQNTQLFFFEKCPLGEGKRTP